MGKESWPCYSRPDETSSGSVRLAGDDITHLPVG